MWLLSTILIRCPNKFKAHFSSFFQVSAFKRYWFADSVSERPAISGLWTACWNVPSPWWFHRLPDLAVSPCILPAEDASRVSRPCVCTPCHLIYLLLYRRWVCCSVPHSDCFQVTVRWIFKTRWPHTLTLHVDQVTQACAHHSGRLYKLMPVLQPARHQETFWAHAIIFVLACWPCYSDPLLTISYRRSWIHLVCRHTH